MRCKCTCWSSCMMSLMSDVSIENILFPFQQFLTGKWCLNFHFILFTVDSRAKYFCFFFFFFFGMCLSRIANFFLVGYTA